MSDSSRERNELVTNAIEKELLECDSEEGVTVGLIDAIIACFNSLKGRSSEHPQIREAYKDLAQNPVLKDLIGRGLLGFDPDKLIRAWQMKEIENLMAGRELEYPASGTKEW